ncbi:hypothetical protein BDW62DRAFT_191381 [Aspergillus aurantiobrunneus]
MSLPLQERKCLHPLSPIFSGRRWPPGKKCRPGGRFRPESTNAGRRSWPERRPKTGL